MLERNAVIYQVFVRNHTKEGTFTALIKDLDRISDLGIDVLYLLPIHEIGEKGKKGTCGSPYAIKDYFSICPSLGTLDDFKALIKETHNRGMKLVMDMVFHHTSRDSILLKEHPEFYYLKDGKPGNRVGDWSDVYDLNTEREDVQKYFVDVLKYWVSLGVDGFRFDVASAISLDLFKKARKELGKEIIFIAESVEPSFVEYLKSINHVAHTDEELVPTFDTLYNYNWYREFAKYLKGEEPITTFVNKINEDKLLRLNCVENHDNERIASLCKSKVQLLNMVALSLYLKGNIFIYAGEEIGVKHLPELFEKDPIDWNHADLDILELYSKVINEKHDDTFKEDYEQHLKPIGKFGLSLNFKFADGKEHQIIFNLSVNKDLVAPVNDHLFHIQAPIFAK